MITACWQNLFAEPQEEDDERIESFRLHEPSFPVIAKALGHQTIAATQIYSRLMSDPVRDAMEYAQWSIHLLGELTIDATER